MADSENGLKETSDFAASGFRPPSAHSRPKSTAQIKSNAIGQAFLDKMAPPRPRAVAANEFMYPTTAPTPSTGTGEQDVKTEAKKAAPALEITPPKPRGSMPSTPSSISHPTSRLMDPPPLTTTRPAPRPVRRPTPPAVAKKVHIAPPPTDHAKPLGQRISKTTKTYRGYAAFNALADLETFTPSLKMQLKHLSNGDISCIISGYLSSHPFDDALEMRVDGIQKMLGLPMLHWRVGQRGLEELAQRIMQVREGPDNFVLLFGRLVKVVMAELNYARTEDVVAEIRITEDQFLGVIISGLKWDWQALLQRIQVAFGLYWDGANGKLSRSEKWYYENMPMQGLHEVRQFLEQEKDGSSSVLDNPPPGNKRFSNDKPARKILAPTTRKRSQRSRMAKRSQPDSHDSGMEVDPHVPDDAVPRRRLDIHSPIRDASGRLSVPVILEVLHLSTLRSIRKSGAWFSISTAALRGFLVEHGRPMPSNASKDELVGAVTKAFDRKFRGEQASEEKIVLWEQDHPASPPVACMGDLQYAYDRGQWDDISAISIRNFLNENKEAQEWDATKEEMIMGVVDLIELNDAEKESVIEMKRRLGVGAKQGGTDTVVEVGEEKGIGEKKPKIMLKLKNAAFGKKK